MVPRQRILVTGGAGFLGLWIVRGLLHGGAEVRSMDGRRPDPGMLRALSIGHGDVEWIEGSVEDRAGVAAAVGRCDAVVHAAALDLPASERDPGRCLSVNGTGSMNVFAASAEADVRRLLFVSSAAASGQPPSVYGAVKLVAEKALERVARDSAMEIRIVRPFVILGVGRVAGISAGLTAACQAAASGHDFLIPFSGASWIDPVEDLAAEIATWALTGVPAAGQYRSIAADFGQAAVILSRLGDCSIGCTGEPLPVFVPVADADIRRDEQAVARSLADCVGHFREIATQV